MFLGKTIYSKSVFLHPGVHIGTGELLGKPKEMLWGGRGGLQLTDSLLGEAVITTETRYKL